MMVVVVMIGDDGWNAMFIPCNATDSLAFALLNLTG